jgi:type I restriction enzyme S subunit
MKSKTDTPALEKDLDKGELPEDWCRKPLGKITKNFDSKRIPLKSDDRKKRQGTYPYYGASGIIDTIDDFIFDGDFLLIAEDGANLLSRNIPIAFQAHGKFWVNNHAHIVQTNDEIDQRFLKFFLNNLDIQLYVTGSAQPKVTQVKLNSIPVPYPSLAEQQRIVARVEALLTEVNAARDRLSRVPLIMKKFRQAVLAAACSGRLTEGWREENPEGESGSQLIERIAGPDSHSIVPYDDDPPHSIPEIPETWEWSRCFLLCDPERDITYGVIKLGAPIKGGIPTLRSSDVRWLHIDNRDVKEIDPDIASQYSRTFLKGGEIVITVRGSLGGIAVVPQSMAGYNVSREVAVLPLLSDLDAKYFSYAIASIWSQNWLSDVIKGVAYTGINIRDLKRLPLPLPPLAEQHEIVRRVGMLFERADAIDREVAAAGRRCERLTQAVLAKAFAGKL